jgi:hypothetical protein
MKQLTACLSAIILLASCSEGKKKVIIISEGTADVNTDARTITTKGRGHEEKTVLFYGDGSIDLKVTSPTGNATVTLADNGVYFLNTKKDTIVGSFVNYTAPKKESRTISDAEMQKNIDSLELILSGKVQYGKTYFILPNQAVKITENEDATIITPFHQMTSLEVKPGQTPEVYRFYPIKETRATLEKLKGMMGITDKPVNE